MPAAAYQAPEQGSSPTAAQISPTARDPQQDAQPKHDWIDDIRALPGEQFLGLSNNGDIVIFVNSQYRTTAQGTRIIFVHTELKKPSPRVGYLSSREVWEIDCVQHRSRIRESTAYPERNLTGNTMADFNYSDDPKYEQWDYDAPNTMAEGIDSVICLRAPGALSKRKINKKTPAISKPEII
jgi:hypothetical protein